MPTPGILRVSFPPIPGKSPMQAGTDRLPALLADGFHLAVHREMRQLPVYTLVVAKGGPKLTASDPNDGKSQSLRVLPPRDPAGFTAVKMDVPWFINLLGRELNLPVVDKTSITGVYDITLELHASTPSRCAGLCRQRHLGIHRHSTATRSEARVGQRPGGSLGRRPRGKAGGKLISEDPTRKILLTLRARSG